MGDWIFTVLGCVLAGLGLLGLGWAMFWDRPRGRDRCPKCWYVVDGVPLINGATTCPECGKRVRKARKLRKTRRRWVIAFAPALFVVGSAASFCYPAIRDGGWRPALKRCPDVVIILLIPKRDAFPAYTSPSSMTSWNPYLTELSARTRRYYSDESGSVEGGAWRNGGLSGWERALLAPRAAAMLNQETDCGRRRLAATMLVLACDDPDAAIAAVDPADRANVIAAVSMLVYQECEAFMAYGYQHTPPARGRRAYQPDAYFAVAMQRRAERVGGPILYQDVIDYAPLGDWYTSGNLPHLTIRSAWRDPDGRTGRHDLHGNGVLYRSYHNTVDIERGVDDVLMETLAEEYGFGPLQFLAGRPLTYHGTTTDRGRTAHVLHNQYGGCHIDAQSFLLLRKWAFGQETIYWPLIDAVAVRAMEGVLWSLDPAAIDQSLLLREMERYHPEMHRGVLERAGRR